MGARKHAFRASVLQPFVHVCLCLNRPDFSEDHLPLTSPLKHVFVQRAAAAAAAYTLGKPGKQRRIYVQVPFLLCAPILHLTHRFTYPALDLGLIPYSRAITARSSQTESGSSFLSAYLKMRFLAKAMGLVSLALSIANASPLQKRDFGPVTIYTPPSNYTSDRSLYARSLMLTVNDVSVYRPK